MTTESQSGAGAGGSSDPTPFIERFNERMAYLDSQRAPVVHVRNGRKPRGPAVFPFASASIALVLFSLFVLSMNLGGWTWSSWTYAFSLLITVPLVAIEVKRKAVITGGAALLLVSTVIIAAGLPQYFGYSASHLSWYDLTAHFLGAMVLTLLLWSFMCWTAHHSGRPDGNGRRRLFVAAGAVLLASVVFELLEFMTDTMFGWTNFHPGIDTAGDLIFDAAGVLTAAFLISRHRLDLLRRPFWHAEDAPSD